MNWRTREIRTSAINANLNLTWEIFKGLKFETTFGYGYTSSLGETWATEYSAYITQMRGYEFGAYGPNDLEYQRSRLPHGGELAIAEYRNESYTWRNQFSYVKNYGLHLVTAMVGQEVKSTKYNGYTQTLYGYLPGRGKTVLNPPGAILNNSGSATIANSLVEENTKMTIKDNTSNVLSFYGAFTYTFDERYVLNASIRSDASNRFGQDENKKFNPSLSIGVKWRIGNEPFMAWASSWYDMFDISFSYGWRGNAVEAVSPYLIAKDGGLNKYFQQYTLQMVSLPYPDLGWEKTEDWNLGVDFSFLNGRISAGFSCYNKISHVLASREVPIENGVANAYIDGTTMKNSGYELAVSVTPVRTKDFSWSLSFNTSKVRNTIRNNEREKTREDYINGTAIVSGEKYLYSPFRYSR